MIGILEARVCVLHQTALHASCNHSLGGSPRRALSSNSHIAHMYVCLCVPRTAQHTAHNVAWIRIYSRSGIDGDAHLPSMCGSRAAVTASAEMRMQRGRRTSQAAVSSASRGSRTLAFSHSRRRVKHNHTCTAPCTHPTRVRFPDPDPLFDHPRCVTTLDGSWRLMTHGRAGGGGGEEGGDGGGGGDWCW